MIQVILLKNKIFDVIIQHGTGQMVSRQLHAVATQYL